MFRLHYWVIFSTFCSGLAVAQAISEVDLNKVALSQIQLGMSQNEVQTRLQSRYNDSAANQRGGLRCSRQQCTAVLANAELQENLEVHFNRVGQVYWITLTRREMLGQSPDDCLKQAQLQMDELRQQYSPQDQFQRFRPHSVSLMLNKTGHPDTAENSLFGFRANIRCAPYAKGEAQSEYELRDNSLL